MILAGRKGEWFLAACAPHIRGCNLSTNRKPKNDSDHFHLWRDSIYVYSHAPLDGITFYPEVRYRAHRVFPESWHLEKTEPILKVFMDHSEISGGGLQATEARMRQLIADGWAWHTREGGKKYVHVDELEKIEGPPPEGAF